MADKTKPTNPPLATSIFVALAAIMRDITAIAKDQKNAQQGFNFRGIDDFYNTLHPIFAAHGVVTVPTVLEVAFDKWLNAKQNSVFCARVKVSYKFLATDGTSIEAVGHGEAFDFGDKALNKAMSMAHKYVLAQTFQIPTAQPDGDVYTYDQTVDPTGDPFKGKSLAALEALRDEQLKAGAKASEMSALLGRIAEMKADAQDAGAGAQAGTTTAAPKAPEKAPDKPAAPAAGAKGTDKPAAPAKPEKPKAEKPVAPPATKAPEKDTPPGAAEPDDNDFGGADNTPDPAPPANDAAAKLNAALDFVIAPTILKHADYAGRKLGALNRKEVGILVEKWYQKFKVDIDASPEKSAMRDALFIVKEQWDKTPVSPNE